MHSNKHSCEIDLRHKDIGKSHGNFALFTGAKKGIVVKEVDGKLTNENVTEETQVKDSAEIKFVNLRS